MAVGELALDFNTLFIVFVVVALLWSVRTLFLYFFGGNDPLMRNTGARIEANRKPEELLPVARAYEGEKRYRAILFFIGLMWVLYFLNPDAFLDLTDSVWQAIVKLAQALADLARQALARLAA